MYVRRFYQSNCSIVDTEVSYVRIKLHYISKVKVFFFSFFFFFSKDIPTAYVSYITITNHENYVLILLQFFGCLGFGIKKKNKKKRKVKKWVVVHTKMLIDDVCIKYAFSNTRMYDCIVIKPSNNNTIIPSSLPSFPSLPTPPHTPYPPQSQPGQTPPPPQKKKKKKNKTQLYVTMV